LRSHNSYLTSNDTVSTSRIKTNNDFYFSPYRMIPVLPSKSVLSLYGTLWNRPFRPS